MLGHFRANSQVNEMRVCVLGVGFVGLTLSLMLNKKGFRVYGVDSNSALVQELNNARTNVLDPGIEELLKTGIEAQTIKFKHTSDDLQEIRDCNVFIITVGTPLLDGKVNMNHIKNALNEIIEYIQDDSLVILRSTTIVGAADSVVAPILENKSPSILLAMCPERTVEGTALQELSTLPQIIGAKNEVSFQRASEFFSFLGVEVVRVSNLRAAEITKLINNGYRDLMFGYANEIALLCQEIGVSAREVIEAANHNYPRSNIALPGPSGGPCLEKDPWILVQSGERLGVDLPITRSARLMNESIVCSFIKDKVKDHDQLQKIALLGLSFKGVPQILDIRGSHSLEVLSFFRTNSVNAKISGYEPAGKFQEHLVDLEQCQSVEEAIDNADLVLVLTNSDEFAGLESKINNLTTKNCQVIDFWGTLDRELLLERRYASWS